MEVLENLSLSAKQIRCSSFLLQYFSENLNKSHSISSLFYKMNEQPLLKSSSRYLLIDTLQELYHKQVIKIIKGNEFQLKESSLKGALFYGENKESYSTIHEFKVGERSLLYLISQKVIVELGEFCASNFQKYNSAWIGDYECSIPMDSFCLYRKSDIEVALKSNNFKKIIRDEVKCTEKALNELNKSYLLEKSSLNVLKTIQVYTLTANEISNLTNKNYRSVRKVLNKMVASGEIKETQKDVNNRALQGYVINDEQLDKLGRATSCNKDEFPIKVSELEQEDLNTRILNNQQLLLDNQKQIIKNQELQMAYPVQFIQSSKTNILNKIRFKLKKLFIKKKAPNLNPEETIQF